MDDHLVILLVSSHINDARVRNILQASTLRLQRDVTRLPLQRLEAFTATHTAMRRWIQHVAQCKQHRARCNSWRRTVRRDREILIF